MLEDLLDSIRHEGPRKQGTSRWSGLRTTLLMWFLGISLVPVAIVGVLSYLSSGEIITEQTAAALNTSAELKSRQIQSTFAKWTTDLQLQAQLEENVQNLERLTELFNQSGKPLKLFTKSFQWVRYVEEHCRDMKLFKRTYGFYDLFVIDARGNVLYSVAAEDDLGSNLFHGAYADNLFSQACQKAMELGKPVFSDWEVYGPSGNKCAGFIVQVVVNEDGDKIGLLAAQLGIEQIDSIMHDRTGLGDTGETYLIGADLRMRSNSVFDEEATLLGDPIETRNARRWQEEHVQGQKLETMAEEAFVHNGRQGKPVLGTHHHLNIGGVKMAVVSEIETAEIFAPVARLRAMTILLLAITGLTVLFLAVWRTRLIVRPIVQLSRITERVAGGELNQEIQVSARNEIGELAGRFSDMIARLRTATEESRSQDWLKTGLAELNDQMRGEMDLTSLSRSITSFLVHYLNAQVGAFYIMGEDLVLRLTGSHAYTTRRTLSNEFQLGEGLVGQAALEKESILLTEIPDDYIRVRSGLGESAPQNILVVPVVHEDEVKGVIEIGSLGEIAGSAYYFLNQAIESIAVAVSTAEARARVDDLLSKSQAQSEELQAQQSELQRANSDLKSRSEDLKESESRLQAQQEELQQTNEELEERSVKIEEERDRTQKANLMLKEAQKDLENKAHELEMASKFKSEFLANMSHELRTPLNSLLILSQVLSENREGNLSEKQVDLIRTINSSGYDLLTLINDILDLSKIEAGQVELVFDRMDLVDLSQGMERMFQHVSQEKGVGFTVEVDPDLPAGIHTDRQRVEQVLKNLLSNAFKFTEQGGVTLRISRPAATADIAAKGLDPQGTVAFSVSDSGIGISKDKQAFIFEAFKQADGTTSRQYGGTGLGLSICREFTRLLGGLIGLESKEGEGSTFTAYLPETPKQGKTEEPPAPSVPVVGEDERKVVPLVPRPTGAVPEPPSVPQLETIRDDRRIIQSGDKSLLVIEDDTKFAKIMVDLAHEKGFKCLLAGDGEAGLHLADFYKPSAVILDISLPGMDGWAVMARLKENAETRHIPVHFMSASERTMEAMNMGAIGYLTKPVDIGDLDRAFGTIEGLISKADKELLVAVGDETNRQQVLDIIGNGDVNVTAVGTGQEAYDLLKSRRFDCMVLGLELADTSGMEIIQKIREDTAIAPVPIIVYTGGPFSPEDSARISQLRGSITVSAVESPERLLDDATLFLHRVEANLPEDKQQMIRLVHDKEAVLRGKKILIVDDDMRNVFALCNAFEGRGLETVVARNGKHGLDLLEENPDVDLVLMDIMMPEMDGYEATREIRKQEQFQKLPIIALTAKAMRGDRKKCIEAGANDYLSKPVDLEKLLSLMRVWLYR